MVSPNQLLSSIDKTGQYLLSEISGVKRPRLTYQDR